MKKLFLFLFTIILFQFETFAQAPENFIPTDDQIHNVAPPSVDTTDTNIQNNNLSNIPQNPNGESVNPPNPSAPATVEPIVSTEKTSPNEVQVSTPPALRTIAAVPDNTLPPHNCQEFLTSLDSCHKEICKDGNCLSKSCEFHKNLNKETYRFSVSYLKDQKTHKCNLKHEVKNSKNETVEFFDCKFNTLQMRQAKVYYTRFLENSEFSFEKPVCIEPTADGGRKIASTCEMSFSDGLKLINIFELGKKFNHCL